MNATRWHVYWRLMRADRPVGTLLLLWPTFWALWLASGSLPQWWLAALFAAGTFLMRSAGCVINDYADRDFDGKVERTQSRPFARGEVGTKEALCLTLVLCMLAALCLLPMNAAAKWLSLPALFLALTYPFTKRFFPIPQFYLGLAFSFGIPMACAAVLGGVPVWAWALFAANACWTLAYDTAYALADKEDDVHIGIQTSAITFGEFAVSAVALFHALFVLILMAVGMSLDLAWPFWWALAYVVYHQIKQYFALCRANRAACFAVFLANNRIGWVVMVGILAALGQT